MIPTILHIETYSLKIQFSALIKMTLSFLFCKEQLEIFKAAVYAEDVKSQ